MIPHCVISLEQYSLLEHQLVAHGPESILIRLEDLILTGVGLFENVYTYTDPNGCANSDTMYIDVIDPINADAGC